MSHPYNESRSHLVQKDRLSKYADEAEDKKAIAKAVHAHEKNMHSGSALTKLKSGGGVHGKAVKARSDRARKRQFGGPLLAGPATPATQATQATAPRAQPATQALRDLNAGPPGGVGGSNLEPTRVPLPAPSSSANEVISAIHNVPDDPTPRGAVGGLGPTPSWAANFRNQQFPGWMKNGGKVKKRARGGAIKNGDDSEDNYVSGAYDGLDDSFAQGTEEVGGKIEAAEKRNYGTNKTYGRKRGGKVGKTNINIIVGGPKEQALPPVPPVLGPPPGGPPIVPPRPPMAPPMAGPPMGGPPPIPPPGPRASGGRTYKQGGGVTLTNGYSTKAQKQALAAATPVQHSGNKQDQLNIGRKKVVTYKTGGAISSEKGPMAHDPPTGSGGGKGRLWKEKRAAKVYKKAV